MSFNGTVYGLTCIVTVDDNVDTNIIISSQWILPTDMIHHTISNTTEKVLKLSLQHSLTFIPLRSDNSGIYRCNTTISSEGGDEYITNAYNISSHKISVKGEPYWMSMSVVINNNIFIISLYLELPLPGVKITFTSTIGSGDDSCLRLKFTDSSNSLTCMAENIPSNLLHPPMIEILEINISTNKTFLTQDISNSVSEQFTCRVCINIPEAEIMDHCSNESVVITDSGVFISKHV